MEHLAKKDYFFFIIVFLCIIMSFYFNPIAALALSLGIFYLLKTKLIKGYCLLLFLMPFAQVFKLSFFGTSLFTILEFVLMLKLVFVKGLNRKSFITIAFYVLYIITISFVSSNYGILLTIKMALGLLLICYFIMIYSSTNTLDMTNSFSLGMVLSSMLGLFKLKIPGLAKMYTDFNMQYINGIEVTRFSGTFTDPNYYAAGVIVAIGLILCCMKTVDIKKNKILVFYLTILTLFGLYTYSKSFLLMLAIMIIIAFKLLMSGKMSFLKMLFILLTGCILIFLIYSGVLYRIPVINAVITRLANASNLESLTTHRTEIWQYYLDYILNNKRTLFIGDGIGAPYLIGATHNMYIEMWYYTGIIGIIFYGIVVWSILNSRKLIKRNIVNYYSLFTILLLFFFLAGYTSFEMPFYLIIAWVVMNTDFNQDKKEGAISELK